MVKGLLKRIGMGFALGVALAGCSKPEVNFSEQVRPNFSREGTNACGLAVADFDGDGVKDIALGDLDGVSLYKGNKKDLSFNYLGRLEGVVNSRLEGGASGLATADFNGDGDVDLLVGDTNGLRIFYNDGGKFSEGPHIVSEDRFPLNHNGKKGACGLEVVGSKGKFEVIYGGINCGTGIYLLEGNRLILKKLFKDVANSRGEKDGCSGVASIDIYGDGNRVILTTSRFGLKCLNLDGSEITTSGLPRNFGLRGHSAGMAVADFNGDGLEDVILAGDNATIYQPEIFFNNANGEFLRPVDVTLRGNN
ncbi:MAG: VCBS repeat-containing protein [Nanoarchaeota archaeon]